MDDINKELRPRRLERGILRRRGHRFRRADFRQSTHSRGVLRVFSSRFSHGIWLTLSSLGIVGLTDFNPPRYPRDAQVGDLENIGCDMHVALERFSEETKTTRLGLPVALSEKKPSTDPHP